MNLPALQILNDNLIFDLKNFNQTLIQRNNPLKIDDLLAKINSKEHITSNFNTINEYIKTFESRKDNLKQEEQIILRGLVLFASSYVDVNNTIAKVLTNKNNVVLNTLIKEIVQERYKAIKPLFIKPAYENDYSKLILKLFREESQTTAVNELNSIQIQVNNLIPNFITKIGNKLEPQDDFKIAAFSLGNKITNNLFRALISIAQLELNKEKDKKEQEQNKNAEQALAQNFAINKTAANPSTGKVLTKEVSEDGPPADFLKRQKEKH